MRIKAVLLIALIPLTLFSCKNRLKPRLYQISESKQFLLKETDSYYRHGFVLTDNPELSYIEPGDGTVLITRRVGPPGDEIKTLGKIFTVEAKTSYQILVGLPLRLDRDSLDLKGRSICRLEGQFNLDEGLRLYRCTEGYIALDSVWASSFRARLSGIYVNSENDTLVFDGDLKAGRRD